MADKSDYIKREDFEKQLKQIEDITALSHIELGEESEIGEISMPMSTVRKILKGCPSADVVEVVRCKDCRYMITETSDEGTSYYWCTNARVGLAVDEWNYCCWGERADMRGGDSE